MGDKKRGIGFFGGAPADRCRHAWWTIKLGPGNTRNPNRQRSRLSNLYMSCFRASETLIGMSCVFCGHWTAFERGLTFLLMVKLWRFFKNYNWWNYLKHQKIATFEKPVLIHPQSNCNGFLLISRYLKYFKIQYFALDCTRSGTFQYLKYLENLLFATRYFIWDKVLKVLVLSRQVLLKVLNLKYPENSTTRYSLLHTTTWSTCNT